MTNDSKQDTESNNSISEIQQQFQQVILHTIKLFMEGQRCSNNRDRCCTTPLECGEGCKTSEESLKQLSYDIEGMAKRYGLSKEQYLDAVKAPANYAAPTTEFDNWLEEIGLELLRTPFLPLRAGTQSIRDAMIGWAAAMVAKTTLGSAWTEQEVKRISEGSPRLMKKLAPALMVATMPDWQKVLLLKTGARSGDEALSLALQLTNSKPCEKCGYIHTHCRCTTESASDVGETQARHETCEHRDECEHGGRYGKGCYEDQLNNAMGGKPWFECMCGFDQEGRLKHEAS